jgi:uncharacterized Zn finger protein (UPF0148 family)
MQAEAADARLAPLVACPNDGEPLRTGPDGQLYCPFDGERFAAGALAENPYQ